MDWKNFVYRQNRGICVNFGTEVTVGMEQGKGEVIRDNKFAQEIEIEYHKVLSTISDKVSI